MNKSNVKKVLSCNLKYYMETQGISFRTLSDHTGISIPTLERYVRGDIVPNLERCMDISDCLNIKIDWIWIFHKL